MAVPLAMCQLLLGDAAGALAVLEEDDRAQQHLRQQQPAAERSPVPLPAAAAAAGSNGASGATVSSAVAGPEGRHAVMQFIRAQSPQVGVAHMQRNVSRLLLLLLLRLQLLQQQQQCNGCPGATRCLPLSHTEPTVAALVAGLQGEADLRPGLAQFASWWLGTVAYPEFQDTGGRLLRACKYTLAGAILRALLYVAAHIKAVAV